MLNRITVTLFVLIVTFNVITVTMARPQNVAGENADVAAAIRYLQELETKHGQYARPRLARSEVGSSNNGMYNALGYFILEAIDRAHGPDNRPRFGKRGGLIKSYNNVNPFEHNEEMEFHGNNYRISGMIHPYQDEVQ